MEVSSVSINSDQPYPTLTFRSISEEPKPNGSIPTDETGGTDPKRGTEGPLLGRSIRLIWSPDFSSKMRERLDRQEVPAKNSPGGTGKFLVRFVATATPES